MSRPPRAAQGGLIYHALNRANARLPIFANNGDYDAFLRVLAEAVPLYRMRLLAYCVMPNHFHLVVWPRRDGDLSRFMRWLTMTHTQRWHAYHESAGSGHLYQGRFKSFPVQGDDHLVTVCRYVERNAVRGGLAPRAERWRWCSLWSGRAPADSAPRPELSEWPIPRPPDWVKRVNTPLGPAEEDAVQRAIQRSQPFGATTWQARTANRLGLDCTLNPLGRPKKR